MASALTLPRAWVKFLLVALQVLPVSVSGNTFAFGDGIRSAINLARAGSDVIAAAIAKSAAANSSEGVVNSARNVVIKLHRVNAKTELGHDDIGFFIGKISVGRAQPQEFSVLFDTAAGNVVLPAADCSTAACVGRPRYASGNATPIDADGRVIELGDKLRDSVNISFAHIDMGEGDASGPLVHDNICLGSLAGSGSACTELGIVAARTMDDVPFRAAPWDGMVGLGLDALTVESPLFNLLRSLSTTRGIDPKFSIALRGNVGELRFGSPQLAHSRTSPMKWLPVLRPEEGFWQVRIHSVRVGNITLDKCEAGCHGVVDTGASKLGVPAALQPKLAMALTVAPEAGAGCRGPDLHLDLGSGFMLTLRAQDYASISCSTAQIVPLNLEPVEQFGGLFVLGESVLQRYDTSFDWLSKRVAFSLVSPRAVRLGPPEGADVGQSSGPDSGDLFRMFQV